MDGSIYSGFDRKLERDLESNIFDAPKITARLALNEEVLREAWTVRHAAYAAQGLIVPNETGMLRDDWDFSPATRVIVIYKDGDPVATARTSLYAPQSGIEGADAVPSMAMFESEIPSIYQTLPYDDGFARVIDISRLGRHPSLGTDCEPVFAMYRMISYLVLHYKADALISAVQRHHIPFYRRMGYRQVAEPKAHPRLNLAAALMACVRPKDGHLRESIPVLGLVAESDSNYAGFIRGDLVPVFGTGTSPAELNGTFGGRMVGVRGGSRARQERSAALPQQSDMSVAA